MCSAFTIASRQNESGGGGHVNLSIGEKLELIKKLESGVSVVRVYDRVNINKQLATFGGLKINSQVLR